MSTGLSLETLAQVVHADKQRAFAQECIARQVKLAPSHDPQETSDMTWWAEIRRMNARQLVVTLAVHPLRLTVQWA